VQSGGKTVSSKVVTVRAGAGADASGTALAAKPTSAP
jgi:hypothetical protein